MNMSHHAHRSPDILEQVKAIVLKHVEELPVIVYLFGSWAKQKNRQSSDIDVAIWSESPLPSRVLTNIRFELEESTIPYRVDLVDLTRADEQFVRKVQEKGIVWKDFRNE